MKISKKGIGIIISVVILAGALYFIYYMKQVNDYKKKIKTMTFSSIDLSSVPDGKYIGESDVDFISVKVEVLVKDGKIISIDLLKHENDRGSAAEQIIEEIIKKQTTDVDAVSGATNSSKVIRKAVENALYTMQ